jgi:two-component system response regulator HupR/HoxA
MRRFATPRTPLTRPRAYATSAAVTDAADLPITDTRPAVLVVDDEQATLNLVRITLRAQYTVYTAADGPTGLELLAAHPDIAVAIIDQRMPDMSGTAFIQRTIEPYPNLVRIILTGYTDIESLIEAINAGRVYRYLTKPWKIEDLRLAVQQGLEVHRLALENVRLQDELRAANARLRVENTLLKREVKGLYNFEHIVGTSPALQQMLGLLERVVASDTTVLILGETGTGKELIAQAIHYNGPRADQPFVIENCGAIAPELLTSELFGHRRGAFTGATEDREGLFAFADGGTVFLDEIGDCPPDLQTRLLRVLDHGEIRRVGDNQPRTVDVRIIAATHHDLDKDVQAGRFRRDLYYRLSVLTITPPPLRQRTEDIPILAQHFLDRLIRTTGKPMLGLAAETLARLCVYPYPGNVRELENEIKRAFTLAEADSLITPDLLSAKFSSIPADTSANGNGGSLRAAVECLETRLIQEALARNHGNQSRAASDLGIGRRTLLDKLQRYGIR